MIDFSSLWDTMKQKNPLKETKISGFRGTVTLSARLSPPLLELWRILLAFAPYAGIGIKTSLGMGV